MSSQLREWAALEYFDSERALVNLGTLEEKVISSDLPQKAKGLRTRELRPFGERRQAALFCYGMSCVIGTPVAHAHVEREDYDCVARFVRNDTVNFCAVQLKELVPPQVNAETELEAELAKLSKYTNSQNLTVAVYINRPIRLDSPPALPSNLKLGGLWLYGSVTPDCSRWMIYGDLLAEPTMYEFAYPT